MRGEGFDEQRCHGRSRYVQAPAGRHPSPYTVPEGYREQEEVVVQ
ncbi:hypothetical protein L842_6016 [Mycobacterium intracellulare MIN_052511_1280]|nr:hypothetical protein L842_6016 [Mycobacterium intracellulare MIN_052511_1280]